MINFTLRQLTFLIETARRGGIAPAARHLNVSAAAVSAAIDKLEERTQLTLFDRFPAQGMRLTREGAEFAEQAAALLAQADALGRTAAELGDDQSGVIYIGTHYAIAHRIVLPAILAFQERYPRVRIEVMEDDYPGLVHALDAGRLDALVVFDRGFDASRYVIEVLMDLPPLVLLSSGHRLAAKQVLSLSDLQGLPYIAISQSGPGPSYLDLLRKAGIDPEVPLTSQSRELVQAYVGKGFGYSIVGFPPREEYTIEGETVVARPIEQDIGQYRAVIARAPHVQPRKLVNEFLQLCRPPDSAP